MDLARVLELLAGFDRATAGVEFHQSVRGALDFVQHNLAVARASVGLLQDNGEGFLLFDTSSEIAGLESGAPYPRNVGSLDETVRTGAAVYRPDIRTWPHPNRVDQALIQAGLLTTFTMPLVVAGHCIGAFAVAGVGVDSISPTDRAWLELVAPRLAHIVKSSLTLNALAESEARFRAVFDAVSDGLLVADLRSRRFLMANPAMGRLLGMDTDELASMALEDVLSPSALPAAISRFDSTLAGDRPSLTPTTDVPLRQRDGSLRLVDIGTSFMVFHGQECVVGMFRDAEERKRRERELLQSEKLESTRTLAAGIAHDFNNLLTGIVGNLSLAQLRLPPDHPVRGSLDEAQRASARATELTRRLLTFTKGGKPIRRVLELPDVIKEAAMQAAHGSGARCVLDLQTTTWPVTADADQIAQVVRNLVLNAAQAMPHGGVIHVSTRNVPPDAQYGDERVCITVRDEGAGIPAHELDKIYLPFFTTKQKGAGLGLSVVYSIVANHDGQVTVESEVGKGTTVRFWLPATPAAERVVSSEEAASGQASRRILIMDDEDLVRRVAAAILQHEGYETTCVSDGKEAIDAYAEQMKAGPSFDLVILDLSVPGGMGGKEAAAGILAVDANARILVSSGYSHDEVMSSPSQFGLAGVIPKPFDAKQLCDEVRRVLQRPRSTKQA